MKWFIELRQETTVDFREYSTMLLYTINLGLRLRGGEFDVCYFGLGEHPTNFWTLFLVLSLLLRAVVRLRITRLSR